MVLDASSVFDALHSDNTPVHKRIAVDVRLSGTWQVGDGAMDVRSGAPRRQVDQALVKQEVGGGNGTSETPWNSRSLEVSHSNRSNGAS